MLESVCKCEHSLSDHVQVKVLSPTGDEPTYRLRCKTCLCPEFKPAEVEVVNEPD